MTYLHLFEDGSVAATKTAPSADDHQNIVDGVIRIFATTGDVREVVEGGALEEVPEVEEQ